MEMPLGQRLRDLPGPLLLTGHTGFKGTWMTLLLEYLQIPVVGYSLQAERDSLFDRAACAGVIPEEFADIREYSSLERFIDLHRPSTIIHMAAQPLVLKSYRSPRETFDINVMGTVNLLDVAFKKDFVKAVIVVTTDKVYRNDNIGKEFIESDPLEGKDPYSASKVGTEAVVAAWQQIAKYSGGPKVVAVRSGNVIGGGDFAENRIIPDLIRGVIKGNPVEIRNPESTRPWQHVLDPLIGYILSLEKSLGSNGLTRVNFGPTDQECPVIEVAKIASLIFPELKVVVNEIHKQTNTEAAQLQLNSRLAAESLGWKPRWTQEEAIKMSFNFWRRYLNGENSLRNLCMEDIEQYFLKPE